MLEGLNVIESGNEPAVRFCGWLFAMNDASVTRVSDVDEKSSKVDLWSDAFLNSNKTVLDRKSLPDSYLHEATRADIVIGDPDTDWAEFDSEISVTGTVDAFGQDGPYANWQGNELVFATLGGASGYTFTRDDIPVYGYGDRYQYAAGMYLYQSLCACLLQADIKREGVSGRIVPRVRVSNFESVVSLLPYLTTQYEYNQTESTREQSGPRFVARCTDGFVVAYGGFEWEPIAKTLDRMDLVDDERFVANSARFENIAAFGDIVDEWTSTRTVEEVSRAGQANNVAISEVRSLDASLLDESLNDRDAWRPIKIGANIGRVPVVPYTVNGIRPHQKKEITVK